MKALLNKGIYSLSLLGLFMLLWLIPPPLSAQNLRPGHSITSRSKQFVITSSVSGHAQPTTGKTKPIPDRVRLNPASLANFAGSVKEQWVRQFEINQEWQGHIYLHIVPGRFGDPPDVRRISSPKGGWDYRAILPQEIAGRTLTQVIINLLLKEFSGRYSMREPKLPPWLTAGSAELLLQTSGPMLFVPFHTRGGGGISFNHPQDPLHASRKVIEDLSPVSFLTLSLPPADLIQGARQAHYRAYSHLLTYKLLKEKDGSKRMQFFLRELPKHKNTSSALGVAYGHETMLRIEQWWSLAQTQFRSRDAFNRWRPKVILNHLSDSLLLHASTTPSDTKSKPQTRLVRIQEYISNGTRTEHTKKLSPLLQRLRFLQVNSPPETARLIQDYHLVIESYLGINSPKSGRAARNTSGRIRVLRDYTINQLSLLDTILMDLISESEPNVRRAKQTDPSRVKAD